MQYLLYIEKDCKVMKDSSLLNDSYIRIGRSTFKLYREYKKASSPSHQEDNTLRVSQTINKNTSLY